MGVALAPFLVCCGNGRLSRLAGLADRAAQLVGACAAAGARRSGAARDCAVNRFVRLRLLDWLGGVSNYGIGITLNLLLDILQVEQRLLRLGWGLHDEFLHGLDDVLVEVLSGCRGAGCFALALSRVGCDCGRASRLSRFGTGADQSLHLFGCCVRFSFLSSNHLVVLILFSALATACFPSVIVVLAPAAFFAAASSRIGGLLSAMILLNQSVMDGGSYGVIFSYRALLGI